MEAGAGGHAVPGLQGPDGGRGAVSSPISLSTQEDVTPRTSSGAQERDVRKAPEPWAPPWYRHRPRHISQSPGGQEGATAVVSAATLPATRAGGLASRRIAGARSEEGKGSRDADVTATEERSLGVSVSEGDDEAYGPTRKGERSTFQTFGEEVCPIDHSVRKANLNYFAPTLTRLCGVGRAENVGPEAASHERMCPAPSSVHREPICCECQAKFGGRLPVRRAEAKSPWTCALGTTAGESVTAKGAVSSSGSSSRPFTRLSRWPRGSQQASRPPSCPSASAS
eukprot:bmy_06753T0